MFERPSRTSTWKEGAIEKRIAGKWHITTLQEAIENVDHEPFANRFHVTQYWDVQCCSTRIPFSTMSRSNPFSSTIPGASCLIKWLKENQAGFCRTCYHVLRFVDNLSATKKHSRSCGYILTAFTRRNVAWERSSTLQFMQWCFKKMWTWLLVTSMELRGDATTTTIIASLKRPLLTALCRCLPAPHHYRDPDRFLAGTTKHGSTSTLSGGTMYNRGVRNIVKGSSWKNGRRRTTTAGRVSVSVILWATIRFLCDIVTIRARPWGDLHRGFCVRLHQVTWWRYTFVLTGARVSFILLVIHPHCMHDHPNTACPHQKKENKRPPDQTLCGNWFGKICWMHRNAKKSKSALSKNRSSTKLENCVVFTLLIQMMMNSWISWRMRVCQLQCFARLIVRSTGRLAALKRGARQNTLALLRPTNLRESVSKELFIKVMKIVMREKDWIQRVTTIFLRKCILVRHATKKQDATAAVDE